MERYPAQKRRQRRSSGLPLFLIVLLTLSAAEAQHEPQAIVGGTEVADPDAYPYFCTTDPLGCGCVLIAPDMLLTAAHCSSAFFAGKTVHIGGLRLDGEDAKDTQIVDRRFPHPEYNDGFQSINDIMLVRLKGNTSVTDFATLNTDANEPSDEDTLIALGHGRTSEGGPLSQDLLQVAVPVVAHATCNGALSYNGRVDEETMLCAGDKDIDSCQGDSGGPLLLGQTVVGLTSWGEGCARENKPGVYARISSYEFFIQYTVCTESRADLPTYCDGITVQPTPSPPPPPPNDACADAIEISIGDTASGSNVGAASDGCGETTRNRGTWFKFQGTGANMVATTCSTATNFDTIIDIVQGDCSCSTSFLVSNDDYSCSPGTSKQSQVQLQSEAGIDYYILVSGYDDSVGDFELRLVETDDGSSNANNGGNADGSRCFGFPFCPGWLEWIIDFIVQIVSAFIPW